jgi:hypothetical protein
MVPKKESMLMMFYIKEAERIGISTVEKLIFLTLPLFRPSPVKPPEPSSYRKKNF